MKRFISFILCVLMVFGTLPQTIALAAAGDTGSVATINGTEESKVADPATLHDWKKFFGTEFLSTENAGGVWADKSVFESVEDFKTSQAEEEIISGNTEYNALAIADDNFLVALSGIAANKEITGYSSIPTDTVFILDLSQSMDTAGYIPTMVRAANSAINRLMDLNRHNRISVILYSGNANTNTKAHLGNATVLLPLDRYTAGTSGNYITYSGNSNDTTVSVARGVRNSEGTVSGSKQTVGGTYIQAGLYLAAGEFKKAYEDGTTVIESGLIQGGTQRIPIITLMSDGRPTIATDQYSTFERTSTIENNRVYGVSNVGNGGSASANNNTTFLTQLTAKWLKENVNDWYDNNALFYSLWLKEANDNSANGTLNPASSNDTLDDWWKTFLNAEKGSNISFNSSNGQFTVTRDSVIDRVARVRPETAEYTAAWQAAQNYVDEAFEATNAADFEEAFDDIVSEIILQSQYYPTLVESGDHDTDGYIVIEDPIGEFMEVKELEGILIGGHLFTGSALIQMMLDNEFGDRDTYTENGWMLIDAIQERIGVNEAEAIALAQAAWQYGQLGYDSATGKYSNYIGWYADANNNYLGFWHKGHTASDVPSGATQVMRSHGFYGVIDDSISDSNIEGEDMMHIAVRIATQLDDGDQTVTFGIPASLIPLVNYKVGVNTDSLATATTATLDVEGAEHPVRLLMEVGLREGINELNVEEVVGTSGHFHTDENGNYLFYTNRWGADNNEGGMVGEPDPTASTAAVSHYNPSVMNERYHYNEDTIIYTDTNGTRYTGGSAPSGSGYYHIVYVFEGTGSGNGANIVKNYVEITAEALAFAEKNAEDNGWHIPQGTMRHDIVGFGFAKTENKTETLPYSVHCDVPGYSEGKYEVYELHGNNGRLSLGQATGIELSKYIAVTIPGTSTEDFVLNVAFEAPEGTVLPETVKVSYDKATYVEMATDAVSVTLDANQKVYIYGLPAGVTYTVTEEEHDDYVAVEASVTGTTVEDELVSVVFRNRAQTPGSVVIRKVVEHPFGANDDGLEEIEFNFAARFETEAGEYIAYTDINTSKGVYTTNSAGEIEFRLTDGDSISFNGLDDGTVVKVFELDDPEGFRCLVSDPTIVVENETVKEFVYINEYVPKEVQNVNIEITGEKELIGREWLDTDLFSFELRYWNGAHWETVAGASDNTVTAADRNFTLSDAMQSFVFNREGDFNFWVIENSGDIGGVTYDATHRYFTVNVVDDWSGEYKIESITNIDPRITYTPASAEANIHVLDMDFTNTYAPAGSDEVQVLIRKNINAAPGITDIDYSGFQFAIFDANNQQVGPAYTTDGSGHAVIKLIFDASVLDTEVDAEGNVIDYKDTVIEYTVKELAPDAASAVPGMTYTTDYAYLSVTLKDNLDGTIDASHVITPVAGTTKVEVEADGTVVFTNDYEPDPASATFIGEKTLNGKNMTAGEFAFELYETGADFDVANGRLIETVYNTVDSINAKHGVFGFETIHYDNVDTHYYVIKEKNAGELINGVTYSSEEYRITVKVTDDKDGTLEAAVTMADKTGTTVESVSFTNTYETETVEIEITKVWAGTELEARPTVDDIGTKLNFQLQHKVGNSGTVSDWEEYTDAEMSVVDNGDNTWTVKYTMEFDKGEAILEENFQIVEIKVPDNYRTANPIAFNGGTITNTYDIVRTSVSATKVWANDSAAVRPEYSELGTSIDFKLEYKNSEGNWEEYTGTNAVRSVSENADGSWSIRYDLEFNSVTPVPEFRIVESKVPENYVASNEGVAVGGIITNSYDLYEKTIEVTKAWANDTEDLRPETSELGTAIDFELQYQNDAGEWEEYTGTDAVRSVSENADGSWTVKYTVTLKRSETEPNFRVVESIVPKDYITPEEGAVSGGTIVNTYNVVEDTVIATKVWANDNADVRPETSELGTAIDFELQYQNAAGEWEKYTGTNAVRSVAENADGTWAIRYDLEFDSLTVIPEFRIAETKVPENYIASNEGVAVGGVITNSYDLYEKVIEATKVWVNDSDAVRPETSEIGTAIDFELQYQNDAGEWKKYTGTNALRSVAENADGSWNVKYTVTLKHSEDEPEFRIAETKVPENYVASNEGVAVGGVITNSYDLYEKVIEATKVWANDNADVRPETSEIGTAIDFELQYQNAAGEWEKYTGTNALRSVAENADGSWNVKYTVTLKHSETEPEFRIAETKVPENYVASNEGVAINGTITNTYEKDEDPPEDPSEPETYLTVRKEWNDNNNKEGVRPAAVEVQIYANGRRYGSSFLLSEANRWTYTATRLPMYDANGDLVEYSAVEVNVPKNYSVSYDTSFYKTVVITNTYGEEPGNPETGAPIMLTVCETIVPMEIFLPKKREDEE